MIKKWKKKSSKYLLNNKIFKMREDLVTSPKLGSDHRLIPAIRPFIPFIAGISSMRQPIFLISSISACLIWTIALAILILGIDNIISFF